MAVRKNFDREMESLQIRWRETHVKSTECGVQNGVKKPWVIRKDLWENGLWRDLRSTGNDSLECYLHGRDIQKHQGVHNLKSSWILCANLYFTFRNNRALLASFLRKHVSEQIATVDAVELEYAEPCPYDPASLLGEQKGKRGANQTSPDVAFKVSLEDGKEGLILTEVKFTEHSFYECSGHKRKYNQSPERCVEPNAAALFSDPRKYCNQMNWATENRTNRNYWNYIRLSKAGQNLTRCPAAISGYQLFRQQALAEALADSGKYGFVASCVAYDSRNEALKGCFRGIGLASLSDWGSLFDGKAGFATFTHQAWVAWVRSHDVENHWKEWGDWVGERYGL